MGGMLPQNEAGSLGLQEVEGVQVRDVKCLTDVGDLHFQAAIANPGLMGDDCEIITTGGVGNEQRICLGKELLPVCLSEITAHHPSTDLSKRCKGIGIRWEKQADTISSRPVCQFILPICQFILGSSGR